MGVLIWMSELKFNEKQFKVSTAVITSDQLPNVSLSVVFIKSCPDN